MRGNRICRACNKPHGRHGCAMHCAECSPKFKAAQSYALNCVAKAVRSKKILPAYVFACVDCAGPASVYDHRSYMAPLEIQPVCNSCNFRRGPAEWKAAIFESDENEARLFLPVLRISSNSLTKLSDAPDCAALTLMGPA